MACSGCGKKHVQRPDDVMGGYKHLPDRQIRARLEVYKKKYCKDCDKIDKCDYSVYVNCKKNQ